MKKTTGYLRLMRPANIVTAIADVLAGIAISGFFNVKILSTWAVPEILLLCISTMGLYGGGVVLNDVFDAGLDKTERPERPIPSGLVSLAEASMLGGILLVAGILAAFACNRQAGMLAVMVAVAAVIYNRWSKHNPVTGPLNMGICRGLNLLLGVSIIPAALNDWWGLATIPIIYIASITMISRGEVHGGSKNILYAASFLYGLVIGFILYFSYLKGSIVYALLFLVPFAWMIFTPLIRAIKDPVGANIGKAVKAGVIALILMDAAWAAAFNAFTAALVILLLLPLSIRLGRLFAVT